MEKTKLVITGGIPSIDPGNPPSFEAGPTDSGKRGATVVF